MVRQLSMIWRVEEHINAGEFRKRLRGIDGNDLPPLLFWHSGDGGSVGCGWTLKDQSRQASEKRVRIDNSNRLRGPKCESDLANERRIHDDSMSRIRFFHTAGTVGIHFIGLEMIQFARDNVIAIVNAGTLASKGGTFMMREEDVTIQHSNWPVKYFIPSLALKNPNFSFLSPSQYCERVIRQDILRQANILGLASSVTPESVKVSVVDIKDEGKHWVRAGSGSEKTGGCLRLRGLEVTINLDLKGCWSAGALSSKGFGIIHKRFGVEIGHA